MATAFCPECEEKVTLPSASSEATVQCPLCEAEFCLSDLLETIPPTLLVINDPGAEGDSDEFSFDDEPVDTTLAVVVEEEGSPAGDGFLFSEEEAPVKAPTLSTSSRPKTGGGGGLRPVIQVVLGGLLALPLAQFALWYWPWGPQDPFHLGPELSRYAVTKWAIPAQFQAVSSDGETDDLKNNPPPGDRSSSHSDLNDRGSAGGGATQSNPFGSFGGTGVNPRNDSEIGGQGETDLGSLDDIVDKEPRRPTLDELSNGKPDEIKTGPAPLSPTEYVRGAAKFQGVVLENMLGRAQERLERWNGLPEDIDEKERILENRGLYLMLGQLASGFTFQDTDDETAMQVLGETFEFFKQIRLQQAMLDIFNMEFERTIYENQAPLQGVLLTVTVSSASNVNGYQQAEMSITGTDLKIPLVYSPQIVPDFKSDKTYLVIGSIVRRPRRMLSNYLGLEDTVVVLGTYIQL